MTTFFKKFSDSFETFVQKVEKNYKTYLLFVILIGFLLRFYAIYVGLGSNHYSKIDELEAYIWGQQLRYYGHPRFFTYIPGPYLSLIAFLLIKIFNTVKSLYYFWVFLGTFTIYLLFWLSKKLFSYNSSESWLYSEENKRFVKYPNFLSTLICLIFAVFPWSIKYTVSYWNPHFIIVFSTLLMGFLFDILTKEKSKNILGLIISITVMPFFHMIIIYAIPVILLMIILTKRLSKINYLYLFIGIFLSILIWIPFLIFDKNNNFFILNSYLHHDSIFKFHPETLKMIINPFLIITLDISRFTGHYFFEYKYFLDKAYGFFIIGLIPVLSSIFLAIYSFFNSFKFFSFKLFNKNNINPITYLLFYMIGILLFHLLSLQVHEDRYTVIFFVVPFIILGYSWYNILLNLKYKRNSFVLILSIIILICLILAPYITISHYYQEKYPQIEGKIRFIPSLIFYEKIKLILLNDYFSQINSNQTAKDFVHFIDYDKYSLQNGFLNKDSLYSYENIRKTIISFDKNYKNKKNYTNLLLNPSIKYLISLDNIYITKDGQRQKQILSCISRFINFNTNLLINENEYEKLKENNNLMIYKLIFLPKNQNLPENANIIGEFSDFSIAKVRLK